MTLEYFVYDENINGRKIEKYNVFNHAYFVKNLTEMFKDIEKEKKKYFKEHGWDFDIPSLKDYNKFEKYMLDFDDKQLRNICQYCFWAKCEYEIVLTTWTPSIEREELLRLINEDKEHIEKWGSPAYRYTSNLSACEKIDIFDQLQLNWQIFKRYVFENEKEIKKLNRENLKKYPHLKKN